MSVTLRNASFLYVAHAGSMACARSCTIVVSRVQCTSTYNDGSICTTKTMNNRPYQGCDHMKRQCAFQSLYILIVLAEVYPTQLLEVQARYACTRHYCVFINIV